MTITALYLAFLQRGKQCKSTLSGDLVHSYYSHLAVDELVEWALELLEWVLSRLRLCPVE